ncbi:hypothetical protein HDU86_005626 [Geranomyces michiganensis]|nr:hypothetical protein HDU86_005626 [Geranomyces michiganensis]
MNSNTSSFLLLEASPAHIRTALDANYAAWGSPLAKEDYLAREHALSLTPFSQSTLKTWVLVDQNAPETVLSSCETYTHQCLLRRNGTTTRGECLAIASVFTPESHRRKNYARTMLSLLRDTRMKSAVASILYSDIGPEYYALLGWAVHPSRVTTVDVAADRVDGAGDVFSNPAIAVVTPGDLPELITRAQAAVVRRVEKELSSTTASFAVLPTVEKILWFHAREVHYAKTLKPAKATPDVVEAVGMRLGEQAFILWYVDFAERKLKVLLAVEDGEQAEVEGERNAGLRELVRAARAWAATAGLEVVEVWDVNVGGEGEQGMAVTDRKTSLSSLAVLDGGLSSTDVTWVGNERYAWV